MLTLQCMVRLNNDAQHILVTIILFNVFKQDVFIDLTFIYYHNAIHVVVCICNKLYMPWYLLQSHYLWCLDCCYVILNVNCQSWHCSYPISTAHILLYLSAHVGWLNPAFSFTHNQLLSSLFTRQHKQLATSCHLSPSPPQQAPWLPLFLAHCCEPRYHRAGCLDFRPHSSFPRACPAESHQLLFHLFCLWTRPVLFNQLVQCIELLNSSAVPPTIYLHWPSTF